MRQMLSHQAWIVLVGLIVFFTNLGSAALFDMDEAIYASSAREMAQRGDWVVPYFNGQMSPDKPPLMFWMMMLGTALFGTCEFAVRIHSAVCAIGTALATYHIGRLLFRAEVGFWAGLIVSTSIIFTVSARAATVDSMLTFLITAAILVMVADGLARRGANDQGDRMASFLPRHWLGFVAMYALMALAVLAKGSVAVIMTGGAIGLFLLMMYQPAVTEETRRRRFQGTLARAWISLRAGARFMTPMWLLRWTWRLDPLWRLLARLSPGRILRGIWTMRPLTALLVVGLIAVPWFVMVGLRTDGQWIQEFMAKYSSQAFKKPIFGHSGPWFYHLVVVFIGFFPWSVFLGPTIVETVRRIRGNHPWRAGYILASCWAVAIIGFWSLIITKLPHYILPAYPALALLTAPFIYSWITEHERMSVWWMRNAGVTLVVVGVGMIIALPIIAAYYLPGEGILGLVGLTLIVGGALCLYFTGQKKPQRAMVTFAAASVAFLTAMFGFAVLRIDRHHISPTLAAELHEASPGELELASYGYFRESFVYYTGSPVAKLQDTKGIQTFLDQSRRPYLITTDKHEASLRKQFPGRFTELTRHRQFLGRGEVVVLAGRPNTAVPLTATRPHDSSTGSRH
ncbi:MAG: glycosyltransferase family 39 protein [Pirellulales bacterium]|nr:glycosyltransferase family 39 protein [Pirellulales bacterium]